MFPQPCPHVVRDLDEVSQFVGRQFGLEIPALSDLAAEIYSAFISTTALDPKGFNGTSAWAAGTRGFRARIIPLGWRPEDPKGQPRVVSRDGRIAVTVSSGNANTGNPTKDPMTRNDKGSQTAQSLSYNRAQGEFDFGDNVTPIRNRIQDPSEQTLWVLLYYIDVDAHEFRFEISRPTSQSESGHIVEWSERYILPPFSLLPPNEVNRNDDTGPDIDFNVTPKRG
jgi:hypothetical protein